MDKHIEVDSLVRAYSKAAKKLRSDQAMTASAVSAGFIFPLGQKRGKRKGYQVFVKVSRYDDEVRKANPLSGGLLEHA